jgi:hypothetical protein
MARSLPAQRGPSRATRAFLPERCPDAAAREIAGTPGLDLGGFSSRVGAQQNSARLAVVCPAGNVDNL